MFNVSKGNIDIEQSSGEVLENSSDVIIDASIQIGNHHYRSNWAVLNCRYDVTLGITWHHDNYVIEDYRSKILTVNGRFIPVPKTLNTGNKISNISVKKFRSHIRKNAHKDDFEIYHVTNINNLESSRAPSNISVTPEFQENKEGILKK